MRQSSSSLFLSESASYWLSSLSQAKRVVDSIIKNDYANADTLTGGVISFGSTGVSRAENETEDTHPTHLEVTTTSLDRSNGRFLTQKPAYAGYVGVRYHHG